MSKTNLPTNFNKINPSEQMRVVRGYAIISKGDTPQRMDNNSFSIPSQNGNGNYIVKMDKKVTCTCPDYENRKMDCKHIHAVRFYMDFNNRVKIENKGVVEQLQPCPYCNSQETIGAGKRHTKNGQKQRYRCLKCNKRFIEEKDFQRYKGNGKVTTLILDLYFKGISLRGIQDHLKQFHNLSLDHANILRRVQKYSMIINEYVKTLKPEVASVWKHDEMKVQAGGDWKWLWNIMDEETKFLITTQISRRADVKQTRKFFSSAKEQAGEPQFLVTDGRHSYTSSIKKEMPNTTHVRLTTIRDKRTNTNSIERLNGTIRDRIKTMRGFDNEDTAEIMTDAFRNYYNFIKPHSSIGGITPALKAGIGVEMDGNRWLSLLKVSIENAKE